MPSTPYNSDDLLQFWQSTAQANLGSIPMDSNFNYASPFAGTVTIGNWKEPPKKEEPVLLKLKRKAPKIRVYEMELTFKLNESS